MKVSATRTAWAKAWDHAAICVNMDQILRDAGVIPETVRRRMTAHAIVASGWKQNCWCYNCWGVKTGSSWTGNYYTMTTQEDDGTGTLYTVPDDAWRAFASYKEAVVDFQKRISASSSKYSKSHAALVDESGTDAAYWTALGKAGYYTDTTSMTPKKFASLCRRVTSELSKKKVK